MANKFTEGEKTAFVNAVNQKRKEGRTVKQAIEEIQKEKKISVTGTASSLNSLYVWWDGVMKNKSYIPPRRVAGKEGLDKILGPISMALGGSEEGAADEAPLSDTVKLEALKVLNKILGGR